MEILRDWDDTDALCAQGVVATIGAFDGVHLGHRALLEEVAAKAVRAGLRSVAVTFDRAPKLFFEGQRGRGRQLTTLEDKLSIIGRTGLDYVWLLSFNRDFAAVTAAGFLSSYLLRLNLRQLVLGYDFRFGHNKEGDRQTLELAGKGHNFQVEQLPPVMHDGLPVSSSRIRRCLEAGDVGQAAGLLGRLYSFSGCVAPGMGRGRTLGLPTANLENIEVLLPAPGVYAAYCRVEGDGRFMAALSIGSSPTFAGPHAVEAHLLDFEGQLYGRRLRIEPHSRLRGLQRFNSEAELAAAVKRDIGQARRMLAQADG